MIMQIMWIHPLPSMTHNDEYSGGGFILIRACTQDELPVTNRFLLLLIIPRNKFIEFLDSSFKKFLELMRSRARAAVTLFHSSIQSGKIRDFLAVKYVMSGFFGALGREEMRNEK